MTQDNKTIDFIFDFASPNGYLVYHALPAFLERNRARVRYIPCLLGGIFKSTDNQPPMMAFANVKGKLAYENQEMQRYIARHRLTKFKMNPHFPINTLLVMRGAVAAEADGYLEQYIAAMFPPMWETGANLNDAKVVAEEWAKAGLDAAKLESQTQDPAIKQQLIANTAAAVERGAFGIPTFFIGEQMFFGKDRLAEMEEALA